MTGPLRIAVLVKQVPRFDSFELGRDGRLIREGLEPEMNPYCRRAVAKAVELAAEVGGHVTVFTLGPPPAEDSLREAIAWGADEGVLLSDPAFAGSDTLATASAVAAALRMLGPFDLVLCGRNSVDADTGQVPPEVAELLDLPFAAGVRSLELGPDGVQVRCELDDGWAVATLPLPALLSCAERLCAPAKSPPEARAAVSPGRIRRLGAAELGDGPWGEDASPTVVGRVERLAVERMRVRLDGDVVEQVDRAARLLAERGAFSDDAVEATGGRVAASSRRAGAAGRVVAVAVEPDRPHATRELLGAGARLASAIGGEVVALSFAPLDVEDAGSWGADAVLPITGAEVEEDAAAALARWSAEAVPWAVLAPGTMWGREVLARAAARLRAGLVGDAVDLHVGGERLVAWKPAFGGGLVAAVTCTTPIQMVTVRPGVLPLLEPRRRVARLYDAVDAKPRGRVTVSARGRDDAVELLATANVVVTVGSSVDPSEYPSLQPLLDAFGAQLAATRKVTDQGWMPRSRQVGLTGRTVSPTLYVAVAVAGKFNHIIGARGAGTILAVNTDPTAPIFDAADIGLVADWHEALPLLAEAARRERRAAIAGAH